MKFEEVLNKKYAADISDKTVAGIDIGSRQAKGILFYRRNVYTALIPTGFFMQQTAEELLKILLEESGARREDMDYIVVTGYGRIALKFNDIPYRMVTEIACHGMGAHFIGEDIHTIIDIGGQDSKVIRIDPENGNVRNFAMNDKCAAGTGRFLEKIANVLGYDVTEIGEVSLKADDPAKIDSTCVVFAESEVISSRAKGVKTENLAAGIHSSVARRVTGLLKRVGIESNVLFTGGVSNNIGMKKAFEDLLGIRIADSSLDTVYAGALGAAIFAVSFSEKQLPSASSTDNTHIEDFHLDMSSFQNAMADAEHAFQTKSAGKKAYVAYTCSYTPLEVLAAANVSYMRLLHQGTPEELVAGETVTQSMLCDIVKSFMGGFIKEKPEYTAIDKVYTFYTCGCMKAAVEAINELYVPAAIFNLSRNRNDKSAKEYLASEVLAFKKDLEGLTGETITEEQLREAVNDYNLARKAMREIAEYRKKNNPLIQSSEYQQLIYGYFTMPVKTFLNELQKIKAQLENAKALPQPEKKKLRLMLAGGIVAQGDNKVTGIIENLGASIVVEDNCTGMKPLSFDIPDDEDIYENIAEGYLGKAPCSRMFPKEDMLQYSLQLAREYDVDGVVLYYLKFCPCYSMIEKMYTEIFKEQQIPLLIISGDYSVGDEGQVKTRLEAFIELIQQRKGV